MILFLSYNESAKKSSIYIVRKIAMKKEKKAASAEKQKKEGISQSLIEKFATELQAIQNDKRELR